MDGDVATFGRGAARVYRRAASVIGYLVVFTVGVGLTFGALGAITAEAFPQAPRWALYLLLFASFIPTSLAIAYRSKRARAMDHAADQSEDSAGTGSGGSAHTLTGVASGLAELVWAFVGRAVALAFGGLVLGALILTGYYLWTSMTVPAAIIIGALIIGLCILAARR